MSEISNEIWSITAAHTSPVKCSDCVFLEMCCHFYSEALGRQMEGGILEEGGGRGGRDYPLELAGLSLSSQFFFLFFSFHLSGPCQQELYFLSFHISAVYMFLEICIAREHRTGHSSERSALFTVPVSLFILQTLGI